MDNVTRIGVSLEPDLLEDFDKLIDRKGYITRSEAIRDLIRSALAKEILKEDENAIVFGTITLFYSHHKGGVKEHLMDIQHQHHKHILSSIHVHLDIEQCLEVLIVNGTVKEVRQLSDELGSVKGVTHRTLHRTPVSLGEDSVHAHIHDD
ncbi:MAG: nickel-responsive transcriptional regulator NikR [Euryarchaeota archaeon]|nr:nickel-responsive transcriptional regulator NikR [Euryarchaeota archaeon]